MSRFMSGISKDRFILSARIFNGMIALVAVILLAWSGVNLPLALKMPTVILG